MEKGGGGGWLQEENTRNIFETSSFSSIASTNIDEFRTVCLEEMRTVCPKNMLRGFLCSHLDQDHIRASTIVTNDPTSYFL